MYVWVFGRGITFRSVDSVAMRLNVGLSGADRGDGSLDDQRLDKDSTSLTGFGRDISFHVLQITRAVILINPRNFNAPSVESVEPRQCLIHLHLLPPHPHVNSQHRPNQTASSTQSLCRIQYRIRSVSLTANQCGHYRLRPRRFLFCVPSPQETSRCPNHHVRTSACAVWIGEVRRGT